MTHEESRTRRAKIAKMVKSGMSMPDVAKQESVTVATVYSACKNLGMTRTHKQRAERRKQVAADIKNGMSVDRVSKKHGLCANAIFGACKEHGVKLTLKYRPKPTNAFMILKQLLDGVSQVDAAKKCEVTKQRVNQVKMAARKAGFKV